MLPFCLCCWVVMTLDALGMHYWHDEIKQKRWLVYFTTYLWLSSVLLGVVSAISIIVMGVMGWNS